MTSIGMNLTGVTYWSTEEPFIDRFKTSRAWTETKSDGTSDSNVPQDAYGNPLAIPAGATSISTAFEVDPLSAGTSNQYVLTYSGTATFTLSASKIISSTPGRIVFQVTNASATSVGLTVKTDSSSDPLHDIHVVRSDQVGLFNSGEIFNPSFVDKMSQWDVTRFMGWENTNVLAPITWATRSTIADTSWATANSPDGVPLEVMVKLANEAHTDMWYNVPTEADDGYVRNALAYIRDNLAPDLKLHVEYSNEVWNWSFDAATYAQNQANSLWAVDANGNGTIDAGEGITNGRMVYYGYRSAQVAAIAHQVFGSQSAARLEDVISGQSTNSGLTAFTMQGVAKAGVGAVSSLFSDYAIAPYFGNELSNSTKNSADEATVVGWARSGAAGIDAAFHELQYGGSLSTDHSLASVMRDYAAQAAVASQNGLSLVAYEGGASLTTTYFTASEQGDVSALFSNLLNDPRMGALYTQLVGGFVAVGGSEFTAMNDVGGSATSGYWGVLDTIYDSVTPRYTALQSVAASGARGVSAPIASDIARSTATAADFNGDGHSDILWRNTAGMVSSWWVGGSGSGTIVQQNTFDASVDTSWKIVDTTDFNGDGRADIVWRNTSGALSIWDATATGGFTPSSYRDNSVGTAWTIVGTGDLNGDGKGDLLWRASDGSISSWLSTGTAFTQNVYSHASVGTSWKVAGTADFNGDGKSDILWRNDNGAVAIWTSTGTGFAEGTFFNGGVGASWHIQGLGDFDGDGKADILWRNDSGAVSVWYSNGTGFGADSYNGSVANSWHVASVGDFNGDGRADILWHNDNGALATWEASGHSFNQNGILATVPTNWSIVSHDFTGF